jgi:hypothetical protein
MQRRDTDIEREAGIYIYIYNEVQKDRKTGERYRETVTEYNTNSRFLIGLLSYAMDQTLPCTVPPQKHGIKKFPTFGCQW